VYNPPTMRKFITLGTIVLGVIFVTLYFSELEEVVKTLRHHDLRFLWLAVIVQFLWALNEAEGYRSLYSVMGIKESFRRLLLLASASHFINIIAPSGGMGGVAVFAEDAGRRGHPYGRVTAAGALYILIDYIGFLFVLALGLIVLSRRNELGAGAVTASTIMFAIVLGLGAMIYIGSRSAQLLGDILFKLANTINRVVFYFTHRPYLDAERAHTFAHDIADGLSVLHGDTSKLLVPIIHALTGKALQIAVLALAFLDFQTQFSIGTLIAGFSLAYLFMIVSPTPYGIGFVEAILPLTLSSLEVPFAAAVVITLAYRAVTFWLPLVVGAFSFRLLDNDEMTKFTQ